MKITNLKPKKPLHFTIGFVLVFILLGGSAMLYKIFITKGANYSWLQTDWSGGASTTAVARHTTDQNDWTYYYSKDPLLSTSTAGQLTLSSQTASTTDTATADFSVGTTDNIYVLNDAVYLKKPNGVSCTADTQCTGKCCVSNLCTTAAVGGTCGGGKVFAVTNGTVYVARTPNESTGSVWGCPITLIGAGAQSNTDGAANTTAIDTACTTSGIAADICENLSNGGYTDWYLPAKDQLNTMYSLRTTIGGFSTNYYWSSTEYSNSRAWNQYFGTGGQVYNGKNDPGDVRCIRSF